MELRQLHYFRLVAEEEHFGRASRRLRIVQPALSRQVRLLEEELGLELFERLPRGVRLTAAGKTLLAHCKSLEGTLERAIADTRAAAEGRLGRLHLGFIEVAAWNGIIPQTIRSFRQAYPEVELALTARASTTQLPAILDGSLDGGFFYNPPTSDELVTMPVARHPVVLAVASDSALSGRTGLTLGGLADTDFIGFQRASSPRYFDDLAAAFARRNFVPKVVAETQNEADMLALVRTGLGIAFVNSCQTWRPPQGITFMEITGLDVALELAFVYPVNAGNPVTRRFVDLLKTN